MFNKQAKELWSMDSEEKLEQAKLLKENGTKYFKANKYPLAVKMYKKITSYITPSPSGKSILPPL